MTTSIEQQVPAEADLVRSLRAQAKIRAIFGIPIMASALVYLSYTTGVNEWVQGVTAANTIFIVTMLILAARLRPFSANQLLFATAILDPLLLSAWVSMVGEVGSLAIGFYLFTILGFGLRTGTRLMGVCQIGALIGFSAVMVLQPYWRQHHIVWLSFLFTLILVPLYAAVLVRKLHEARGIAERESQAKSQLLAKVSHELRTPLSGIVAAAQLLSAETEDPRVTNRAETIMGLSRDLLREINDLLDQAKYEARALVLESTLFDLHEQMDRLCLSLEPTAVNKGLAFSVKLDPRLKGRVQGDSHYLSKVLINLAGNAVKFTDHGKVEIGMTLLEERDDRYRVRFSVQDTGIGIPKEMHEKIFEPFFQADRSTARKYGGTGLGMTIAKEIVNLMGGQIRLESEPGTGSLFYFDLAFPRVNTPQRSMQQTAAQIVYGKRVLIVDDNATNLSLIAEMLARDRHEVVAAKSGVEALEVLTRREFDVIFLDFNMGGMDGTKVLQVYRFGKLKPAPVFFLTADVTAATAARLGNAGAVGILHKPITMDGLRQAIGQVCGSGAESVAAPLTTPSKVPAPAPSQVTLAPVPTQYVDYGVIDGLVSMSERPQFLAEVLSSAVTDIERNCNELMGALAARDSERVRDTAHALKGICTTVGATRLETLANRLAQSTGEELTQAGARLRTDVADTSRQSIAAIRSILLSRAVNG
ncbi:MAG: response regulator [Betaproteobacteria bacterium]|nr:response regulator [Betaproteobacteria bacterium]